MFKQHWSVGDWYSCCMTVLCVHALSLYRWQCEQQNCSWLPDRETNNQRLFLTFSCSLSSSSAVRLVGRFRSDAVCCCCSFWFPLAGRQNKHIWLQTFTNYHSSCFFLLSFSPFIILLLCSSSFPVWCSVHESLQNKYKNVLISVRDSMKTSRKVNKIKDFIILT